MGVLRMVRSRMDLECVLAVEEEKEIQKNKLGKWEENAKKIKTHEQCEKFKPFFGGKNARISKQMSMRMRKKALPKKKKKKKSCTPTLENAQAVRVLDWFTRRDFKIEFLAVLIHAPQKDTKNKKFKLDRQTVRLMDRQIEWELVYLFNGISSPYGLFNAKIWFIIKCLLVIITLFSIEFFKNYTFLFVYHNSFSHSYMVSSILI